MNLHYKFVGNKIAFIVVPFNEPVNTAEAMKEAYTAIAEILQRDGLQIVHERIFCSVALTGEVKRVRDKIFRSAGIVDTEPVSFLDGTPPWGEGISGINIQLVSPESCDEGIELIYHAGTAVGRKWSWDGSKYLMLQNLTGTPGTAAEDQTAAAIENAVEILQSENMNFNNVSRTWFYLADVLKWYDQFNMVRNKLYSGFEMMPSVEHHDLLLPASTGIDCHNSVGNALMLNLLAIDADDNSLDITQLSNRGQQDAFRYGSAFSRGTTITNHTHTWLQLSGTASIDETGATVYRDDIDQQIICTLDKISALLAQADATFEDLCAISVFVKKPEYITSYRKIMAERGLDNIPAVCMTADVCRDDLLFEIDAEGLIALHV